MVLLESEKKRLLEEVGAVDTPHILITPTNKKLEGNMTTPYATLLQELLKIVYVDRLKDYDRKTIVVHLFWEMLKNATEHGNKFDPEKSIMTMFWFGTKGIMLAFKDEGDYFSLQSTKTSFERRLLIETSRDDGVGGHGTRNMFRSAKSIFVDTNEKILVLTYLIN